MRKMLVALSFVAGLGLLFSQSASAVPADATAVKKAATATTTTLWQAQYIERRIRHGVVKCYRDFVIGPYNCHYFPDPFVH
jgi:hypothetical protein